MGDAEKKHVIAQALASMVLTFLIQDEDNIPLDLKQLHRLYNTWVQCILSNLLYIPS
jgi:hypothetical protein